MYTVMAYLGSCFITVRYFIPMFYREGYSNPFDYLNARFGSTSIGLLCRLTYVSLGIIYSGILLYWSVQDVVNLELGFNMKGLMIAIGAFSIINLIVGGMRSVTLVDTVTVLMIFLSLILLAIKGSLDFGFWNIWNFSQMDNLKNLIDYRYFMIGIQYDFSFVSIVVGGIFGLWLPMLAVNPTEIQRYLSCRSEEESKKSVIMLTVNIIILQILGFFGAHTMNYFYQIYPIPTKYLDSKDKFITYFVGSYFTWQGMKAIYVIGNFAGSISVVSNTLNSITSLVMEYNVTKRKNDKSCNVLFELNSQALSSDSRMEEDDSSDDDDENQNQSEHDLSSYATSQQREALKIQEKEEIKRKFRLLSILIMIVLGLAIITVTIIADKYDQVVDILLAAVACISSPTLGVYFLSFIESTESIGACFGYILSMLFSTLLFLSTKQCSSRNFAFTYAILDKRVVTPVELTILGQKKDPLQMFFNFTEWNEMIGDPKVAFDSHEDFHECRLYTDYHYAHRRILKI